MWMVVTAALLGAAFAFVVKSRLIGATTTALASAAIHAVLLYVATLLAEDKANVEKLAMIYAFAGWDWLGVALSAAAAAVAHVFAASLLAMLEPEESSTFWLPDGRRTGVRDRRAELGPDTPVGSEMSARDKLALKRFHDALNR